MGDKIIQPGIYFDVPDAEYRSWPAVSQSGLKKLITHSPAHYKWELEHPKEQSDALRMGSALDDYLLSPQNISSWIILKPCQAETKSGKRKGEDCGKQSLYIEGKYHYCGTHASDNAESPKKSMSVKEKELVEGMCNAIMNHSKGCWWIDESIHQVSMAWHLKIDLIPGSTVSVPCKGRIDLFFNKSGIGMLGDLKKTQDARPESFTYSIRDYGYDVQAAFYMDGINIIARDCPHLQLPRFTEWVNLTVEEAAPHGVYIHQMQPDDLACGRAKYMRAIRTLKTCEQSGKYPGYPENTSFTGLPFNHKKYILDNYPDDDRIDPSLIKEIVCQQH